MTTISIEDAQARLSELVGGLKQGEEVAITREGRVVARIVGEPPPPRGHREPGFAKGMLTIVAEDDEHLKDFAGSMG